MEIMVHPVEPLLAAQINAHRPPTESGRIVVFLSLEDEFGLNEV